MGNQTQRIKHAQRLQRKRTSVQRQVKIAKTHGAPVDNAHRFHKRHAMDCGRPHCMLCGNPRKLWKQRTIQEESFDQTKKWQDD